MANKYASITILLLIILKLNGCTYSIEQINDLGSDEIHDQVLWSEVAKYSELTLGPVLQQSGVTLTKSGISSTISIDKNIEYLMAIDEFNFLPISYNLSFDFDMINDSNDNILSISDLRNLEVKNIEIGTSIGEATLTPNAETINVYFEINDDFNVNATFSTMLRVGVTLDGDSETLHRSYRGGFNLKIDNNSLILSEFHDSRLSSNFN